MFIPIVLCLKIINMLVSINKMHYSQPKFLFHLVNILLKCNNYLYFCSTKGLFQNVVTQAGGEEGSYFCETNYKGLSKTGQPG